MEHHLHTQIMLEAWPDEVWRHLTDFTAFPEWNPFITSASGTPEVGQRLRLRLEPPGGKAMTFQPVVTEASPGRAFEWLGHLGLPGVFDGRHRFELASTHTGAHLLHTETFRGVLVRPLLRSLDGPTRAGFEAMDRALARRVEGDRGTG